jgi:acyl dehydratase
MSKVTFDSIEVGQELAPVTRTVTQETFWKYAVASLDYNPVHCDPEWVGTAQPFGITNTVGHGMMTISFMVTVVSTWAYPSMLKITKIDSKLIWPVISGWTVKCTGVISEKHIICPGKNYVVIDLKAENQDGKLLGICKAEVVFPS